jgi:hypothetical protein
MAPHTLAAAAASSINSIHSLLINPCPLPRPHHSSSFTRFSFLHTQSLAKLPQQLDANTVHPSSCTSEIYIDLIKLEVRIAPSATHCSTQPSQNRNTKLFPPSDIAASPIRIRLSASLFSTMASESLTNGTFVPQNAYGSLEQTGGYAATNYPSSNPSAAAQSKNSAADIPKDEVGWYFVEQYYTMLSRSPEKVYVSQAHRPCLGQAQSLTVAIALLQQALTIRFWQRDREGCRVRGTTGMSRHLVCTQHTRR